MPAHLSAAAPAARTLTPRPYLAVVATDPIDEGDDLAGIVAAVLGSFDLDGEDVAVWRIADDRPPRIAAVLHARPGCRAAAIFF